MRPDGLPFVVRRSRRITKSSSSGRIMRLVPVFKGTLRSNDATAMRTSLKNEFAIFQSLSQLFLPTYFVKCRRTLLELNSYGPYPSTEREIKFRRCLFTSSIKRQIRQHVVVVQKRAKKCTKKLDASAKLLFCLQNVFFFFTFSLPFASLDPKVPNLRRITR